MAEKTVFDTAPAREAAPAAKLLPEKCCGHCAHGRKVIDANQLGRTLITCKAGPPTAVVMQTRQGIAVVSHWPTLDPSSDCDTFAPEKGDAPPPSGS